MEKFNKTDKITIIICTSLAILSILILIIMLAIFSPADENSDNQNQFSSNHYIEYLEELYDTIWTIKYDTKKKKIINITTEILEYDNSSIYWQQIALKHGDNSLYVKHNYIIIGKPLKEENWYKLEIYQNYSFDNELLAEFTNRIEMKLIFHLNLPVNP